MTTAWRECLLGDLLDVKHGFAFRSEYFGDSGSHIVLTPGNFREGGGFVRKAGTEKWYSGQIPPEYMLRAGDIVVAMTEQSEGLLGSSAVVPASNLYLHNQRLGLVQIRDESRTDRLFVYHLFNSPAVRQQIRASATGLKIRHTAPSRIAGVRIRVPPIQIQRHIGQFLSRIEDLIANEQRRTKILEETARALYREWFVEFRYPGHQGVRLVQSPVGRIPQGWVVTSLSDVADINESQISSRNPPAVLHYIDISSVSRGSIESITTYALADAPGRARRIVRDQDILWSCVRPNRRSHAMVLDPATDTIASTGFAVLTAKGVSANFLYEAVTTDEFVGYLTNHATGAAYPAVTAETFEKAKIVVPPPALVKRFEAFAKPARTLAGTLGRQVHTLLQTRNILLPRLLSGDVAVTGLEAAA